MSALLQCFALDDLAVYTREKAFGGGESADYRTFFVGRDDVHGVLKYLLGMCKRSLKFNQFGYDDDELDKIIQALIADDGVYVQGTLDKSQAAGAHEKAILSAWSPAMRASFAIGESASHQISHTKGGVIDGVVAWEGSTNWSASGEGTIIAADGSNTGRKAQNNSLLVHINPIEVAKFAERLDEEHTIALQQMAGSVATGAVEDRLSVDLPPGRTAEITGPAQITTPAVVEQGAAS